MSGGRHLALFLPALAGGGAERVMISIAGALAREGWAVDLVLVKAKGVYVGQVSPDVRVVHLQRARMLTSMLALVDYLRRERPAVLLSTLNYANVLAIVAGRVAGVPTRIIVRQSNTIRVGARAAQRASLRMMPWLIRLTYPRADAVVAVSEAVADELVALGAVSRGTVSVIPNPIVTSELFRLMCAPPGHPWLTSPDIPVILAVGRLTPQKDYPTLLRAFQRVRLLRPCRLLILGEGRERAALESMVRDLGLAECVAMPGFVDNPFAYMARVQVVVSSSAWEGLPGVLIQALACGARVVATDCPGGSKDVLGEGRYGRLVPVGDDEAMAEALLASLTGPRPEITAEAWARFSEETSLQQYRQLFERDCA